MRRQRFFASVPRLSCLSPTRARYQEKRSEERGASSGRMSLRMSAELTLNAGRREGAREHRPGRAPDSNEWCAPRA